MNFAQAFAMNAPTVGGLPLATFRNLQQMVIDGHTAVLMSLDIESQLLEQMRDDAEHIVNVALRKARHQSD
jgi:hypothetical protein